MLPLKHRYSVHHNMHEGPIFLSERVTVLRKCGSIQGQATAGLLSCSRVVPLSVSSIDSGTPTDVAIRRW